MPLNPWVLVFNVNMMYLTCQFYNRLDFDRDVFDILALNGTETIHRKMIMLVTTYLDPTDHTHTHTG